MLVFNLFFLDYPSPMSDSFLVLLAQSIENPNFEVAVALGMSRIDTQRILEDKMLASDEHKLLVVNIKKRNWNAFTVKIICFAAKKI